MIIDCIGCLHGCHPKLEGGDVLILTGDLTASDSLKEYFHFNSWLKDQKYRMKIVIAGNHDNLLRTGFEAIIEDNQRIQLKPILDENTIYLEDSGFEFEGVKFWGTPHSLIFNGINPKASAFTGNEEELEKFYNLIPTNIDVLISHTPFRCMLDQNKKHTHCGSVTLRDAVDRVKPKFFVCSHIHEYGGSQMMYNGHDFKTMCVNCSIMDETYDPVNDPIRIVI